ncbi:hypothetical protein GGR52DRAFT_558996 [Hypoxylon sp. FL1284]|nr:hypothetical protein GGR52DRAFT_558996 [Hypoxylon sp. FL1284]
MDTNHSSVKMGITWTDNAERDLLFAMLLNVSGASTEAGQVKVSWADVTETMKTFGYEATRDSVSQRWTKRMLAQLKQNHPALFSGSGSGPAPAPAAKATATKAKATAAKAKKPKAPAKRGKRTRKNAKMDGSDVEDGDAYPVDAPSGKKRKQKEDTPAADPVDADPVADEPVADEPVDDEPAEADRVEADRVGDDHVDDEPVDDESVADEPVADEPVDDELVDDESV